MRADKFLTQHGYFDTRAQAQAAIKAGKVNVNGQRLRKASMTLSETDHVDAKKIHPWVSRGGLKLVHALNEFGVDPSGLVCLDVGASTGGFTDVLRARGAAHIYAVDVGHGQLHEALRFDPRVISWEGQDARTLDFARFSSPPHLIVCDASFISAMKALGPVMDKSAPSTRLITLVKPQFEVGPEGIGKGGLVKSRALADEALSDVSAAISAKGWQVEGAIDSPIKGGSGNREFLLYAVKL